MKKFQFSLQKVLDHRQILEDLAQKEFMEAEAEKRRQEDALAQMQDQRRFARLKAGEIMKAPGPDTASALKQIHEFLVLQAVRIERQEQKVLEAGKLVEEKREILRLKAVDLKIIEKLKEKRKSQYEHERKLEEQKNVDETNVLRFKTKDG